MSARFKRIERKYIHITERDLQIVQATFYARYLTSRQVAQLYFSPGAFSSCKKRLRYLYDRKYLNKRAALPNEPDVYYLGLKGKRCIAERGQHPPHDIDLIAGASGDEAAAPQLMMRHDLTLSQLYVYATLECRRYGWALEWQNSRMLELRTLGVQPDAFLKVEERRAFLEFTAVVPTAQALKEKIAAYTPLLEVLDGKAVVLWLTTSAAKLGQVRQAVCRSVYPDYFLLGLIEEAGEFLTRPLWQWSRAEGKVAFITPKQRLLFEAGGRLPPDTPSLD